MTAPALDALRRLERLDRAARPWLSWPAELREDFEERAAILEFEAGFPREEAERLALEMLKGRNVRKGDKVHR